MTCERNSAVALLCSPPAQLRVRADRPALRVVLPVAAELHVRRDVEAHARAADHLHEVALAQTFIKLVLLDLVHSEELLLVV